MTSGKTAADTGKANEPSATVRLIGDGQDERGYGDYGGCASKLANKEVKKNMDCEKTALKWTSVSNDNSGTAEVWIHDRLWWGCWFILPIACCVCKSVMLSFHVNVDSRKCLLMPHL